MQIDAQGVYYKDLNANIRAAVADGAESIDLVNVNGQYFIGDGINRDVTIKLRCVPHQSCSYSSTVMASRLGDRRWSRLLPVR